MPSTSLLKRTQQWATFSRVWYLFDAKWQNPFDSAKVIMNYLLGKHKPIYHPVSDCGDQVVVINSKYVAMPAHEWQYRVYFHHTGFPGGASKTPAWELQQKDPTMVMFKAVYHCLPKNLLRRTVMQRLYIFAETEVPSHILDNITDQIPQIRPVPKRLDEYSEEEVNTFPKLFDWPHDYILK